MRGFYLSKKWAEVWADFVLIVMLPLAVALLMATACESPTKTPTASPPATPTPVSPLPSPTPPMSPLQEPEAEAFVYSIWGDRLARCQHTGITPTLKIAVKWVGLDTGTLVFSETLDTGLPSPPVTITGQFNGDFFFSYPVNDEDVGEWGKAWWSLPGGGEFYCFDEWGALVAVSEVEAEWFEDTSQDDERYWFVRKVPAFAPTPTPTPTPTPEPRQNVYCPIGLQGGAPMPSPTPTPETGGSGGTGSAWWTAGIAAIVIVGLGLLGYLAWRGLNARIESKIVESIGE